MTEIQFLVPSKSMPVHHVDNSIQVTFISRTHPIEHESEYRLASTVTVESSNSLPENNWDQDVFALDNQLAVDSIVLTFSLVISSVVTYVMKFSRSEIVAPC